MCTPGSQEQSLSERKEVTGEQKCREDGGRIANTDSEAHGNAGSKGSQELTWRAKVCATMPCCDVKALLLIFTFSGILDLQFSMPLIYTSSARGPVGGLVAAWARTCIWSPVQIIILIITTITILLLYPVHGSLAGKRHSPPCLATWVHSLEPTW